MASTILRRYRALLSSEIDDYFQDTDLVDHINDAKLSLVSHAIKLELDQPKKIGRSIRALNDLRIENTYSSLSFTAINGFYQADIDVSGIEPDNLIFIGAKNGSQGIYMTELLQNRRFEMDVGLVQPSELQGYWFYLTDATPDPDEKRIRVFFASNDAGIEVTIMYIKTPQPITDTSEDLIDLPDRLIKAVALRAAIDGANMEERTNTKNYMDLYQEQLGANLW